MSSPATVETAGGEVCAPASGQALAQAEADQLAARLKALAHPARLRILSLISAQGDGEACVCHLTGPLGLTQPTVSHHLKVLHEAGLVEREQRGTWAHYRVDRDALRDLAELLR
jgi:ArsR family transcriptional regulator